MLIWGGVARDPAVISACSPGRSLGIEIDEIPGDEPVEGTRIVGEL